MLLLLLLLLLLLESSLEILLHLKVPFLLDGIGPCLVALSSTENFTIESVLLGPTLDRSHLWVGSKLGCLVVGSSLLIPLVELLGTHHLVSSKLHVALLLEEASLIHVLLGDLLLLRLVSLVLINLLLLCSESYLALLKERVIVFTL